MNRHRKLPEFNKHNDREILSVAGPPPFVSDPISRPAAPDSARQAPDLLPAGPGDHFTANDPGGQAAGDDTINFRR